MTWISRHHLELRKKYMTLRTQNDLDRATERALHYLMDQDCEAVIICAASKDYDGNTLLKIQHAGKNSKEISNLATTFIMILASQVSKPPPAPPQPPKPMEADVAVNTTMTPPAPPKKQLTDFRAGLYYGSGTFKEVPRADFVGNFVMVRIPYEGISRRMDRAWVEVLGVDEDDPTKLYGRLSSVSSGTGYQTGDVVDFTVSEICGWHEPRPPSAA